MDLARGHDAMRSMFYPYRTSGQDSAPLKLVWNQGRGVVHHALLWVFVGFLFPFSKLEAGEVYTSYTCERAEKQKSWYGKNRNTPQVDFSLGTVRFEGLNTFIETLRSEMRLARGANPFEDEDSHSWDEACLVSPHS